MAEPTPTSEVGLGRVVVVQKTMPAKRRSALRDHSRMSFASTHCPRFDPEVEQWEVIIPKKSKLLFVGYEERATKPGGNGHYRSWFALLEAWRCAKALSEDVHGIQGCKNVIGYPITWDEVGTYWFGPGPNVNEDSKDKIYLEPTHPERLHFLQRRQIKSKYGRRATTFESPADVPE